MKHSYHLIKNTNHFIIVNKEGGVTTALSSSRVPLQLEKELYYKTRKNYKVMFPIDHLTSGAVILSEDDHTLDLLREDLNNNQFEFVFDTIIKLPLFFDKDELSIYYQVKSGGKLVIDPTGNTFHMKVNIIKQYKDYAHLQITTSSPMDHAVRLGLSFQGSPVAGDALYGTKEPILLSQMKRHKYKPLKDQAEPPLIQRPAIHLSTINYKGESFIAPFTKDFASLLSKLEKYNRLIEETYFQDILENLKD